MEGLDGPPSDQPFVTPAARRAPVPAGTRMAPVAVRGQSCEWLRPRPPIPGPVIQPAEPARRVADGDAGARISSQGSWPCAGGGRGSPGTSVLPSHASPANPGTRQCSSSAASAGAAKASLREQARHYWFAGAAGLHLWLTALARCQASARNLYAPIRWWSAPWKRSPRAPRTGRSGNWRLGWVSRRPACTASGGRFGLQPWRTETFKLSPDPLLTGKIRDVVGLYLAPPANAAVFSVDENRRSRPWNAPPRCSR